MLNTSGENHPMSCSFYNTPRHFFFFVTIFENYFSEFSYVPRFRMVSSVVASKNKCSPKCAGQESHVVNLLEHML